jgi:glycogen debranching enzyme
VQIDREQEEKYEVVARTTSAGAARVLKDGDAFAVLDKTGDIDARSVTEEGLYFEGTRVLSRMTLLLDGKPLLLLSSNVVENDLVLAVDLTNPALLGADGAVLVPHGTIHVRRSKFLREGDCHESLQWINYGSREVSVSAQLDYEADFADLFEVRGHRRERRGETFPPRVDAGTLTLSYGGLDGVRRTTTLQFTPAPDRLTARRATFAICLGPKERAEIHVLATCRKGPPEAPTFDAALSERRRRIRRIAGSECAFEASHGAFDEWLTRSQGDLRMMLSDTPQGLYPYAGVPWFSTPFGRDGIWTALQALWVNPDVARGVLRFLAAYQATDLDDVSDAEPGKILHELRHGEMAALKEIPFGRYYGSVDSTPLFVMLAGRHFETTADRELLEELWPSLNRALEWIDSYGDLDGDGFVEYGRRSRDGLLQQGWKDSSDSVFHHDGSLADAPIALCEVQGYVYAARIAFSELARVLGHTSLADQQAKKAALLVDAFDAAFWCEEIGTYALALDGKKRPCRVRSSNASHCLFTGLARPERAARIADDLLSPALFSGWGIRTLATGEQRYNPMSYHNGSVWPHDNSIAAAGLSRYGFTDHAMRVLRGLFDASRHVNLHRLPELFCGFERGESEGPILYPVACSPQAWAAGAPFLLLQATLGLRIDASRRRVLFERPVLPPFLDELVLRHLRVGDARIDLQLRRHSDGVGIGVLGKSADVEIVVMK